MTQTNNILPPNATELQRDIDTAIQRRFSLLDTNVLRWLTNPDKCPTAIIPWLAWAMSVDVWHADWNDNTQRTVIRESVQVHKIKGTLGSLKRALAAFVFADIVIEEWFQYGGKPYNFRVYAIFREDGLSITESELILSTIMQTKNLRSHLEYFRPELETDNNVPKVGLAFGHLEKTTIYPRE